MRLENYVKFPDVSNANEDGLLAMGGDLTADTLLSAYQQAIFPWYSDGQPILWWSPDPRMVMFPAQFKMRRSLRKAIKKSTLDISCNCQFESVIEECAAPRLHPRRGSDQSDDTWITDDMKAAYIELHRQGFAHSIEVMDGDKLVGGLYGLAIGTVFYGESMFSKDSNASQIAFASLCHVLGNNGYSLIDCQVENPHLLSLGAELIPRSELQDHLCRWQDIKPDVNFSQNFDSFSVLDTISNL